VIFNALLWTYHFTSLKLAVVTLTNRNLFGWKGTSVLHELHILIILPPAKFNQNLASWLLENW